MYRYVTKSTVNKTLKITGIQVAMFSVGLPFLVFHFEHIFQYSPVYTEEVLSDNTE